MTGNLEASGTAEPYICCPQTVHQHNHVHLEMGAARQYALHVHTHVHMQWRGIHRQPKKVWSFKYAPGLCMEKGIDYNKKYFFSPLDSLS